MTAINITPLVLGMLWVGTPLISYAQGATGWVHPIARDSLGVITNECPAGHALVDVALKEHGSYDNANPAGVEVRLRIVPKIGGATFADTGVHSVPTGVSQARCFNPQTHAILPTVSGGASYYDAGRVALKFETGVSTSLISGNHIRGFVHLLPTSSIEPNISHVAPLGGVALNTNLPTFIMSNNMITPTYNSTSAVTTSVYVRKVSGAGAGTVTLVGTSNAPVTTGEFSVTPSSLLSDGDYQWFFFQTLNGVSNITVSNTDAVYTGFPVSSLSGNGTFIVDTTPPNISNLLTNHVWNRVDDTTVEARMRATVQDAVSGLLKVEMWITDNLGTTIETRDIDFGAPEKGAVSPEIPSGSTVTLIAGMTYTLHVRATDYAGNVSQVLSVPRTVSLPPLITLRTPHEELSPPTNVRLRAEVTAEGSSPIMERRICWRTTDTDIITSGNCGTPFPGGTVGEVFSRDIGPLTPGLYYYQAWVTNAQGLTAVSGVSSFLIGTPSPGVTCSERRRCINTTTSQIYVCYSTFPGHAISYEAAYCKGDTPCLDPNDTGTYTSLGNVNNTWVTVPEKGARYYVYARAQYASGWSNWAQLYHVDSYWCLPPDPVAPTLDSQNWTGLSGTGPGEYQVTLHGRVTSNGGAPLTWRGTCWGTDPAIINNCEQDGGLDVGSGYNHVRTNIPEQRIYFQARAQNSAGHVGRSSPMSFVPGAVNPTLENLVAWDIGINSARIRATIVDDGGAPITYKNVRFCKIVPPATDCNIWSGFYTCGSNDTEPTNIPPQIDFARQCTGSNYGPILVPTGFRYAVCAVNLNNLAGCVQGTFVVDPDNISAEGAGGSTYKPQ